MQYDLLISCPRDLVYLLEDEVRALGLQVAKTSPQGVFGRGNLNVIYQISLWSRLAGRVNLILFSAKASTDKLIQQVCSQYPWQTVFSAQKTFAISFHGTNSAIRSTMYGAQLVKDGIVDYFRKQHGFRPSVDKNNPEVHLAAYLKDDELTLSFDLSGTSLHQRSYRLAHGEAPLKEHLAAALLIRANWPKLIEEQYDFYDPFCGSGTIVIEAAMLAASIAPGLTRKSYGFMHWALYDEGLWNKVKQAALSAIKPTTIKLRGTDLDAKSISQAQQNAARAGVDKLVEFKVMDINNPDKASSLKGLIVCNPPYGERLENSATLVKLYQSLGAMLANYYRNWQVAVLTQHAELAKAIGLRSHKQYAFLNGKIACALYLFSMQEANRLKSSVGELKGPQAMLVNRLNKKLAHLEKWAKRCKVYAYRIYDADLPEYAFALDRYNDYCVLQEYAPPKDIPPNVAEKRRIHMMQAVMQALKIEPDKLICKLRQRQKGKNQYQKSHKTTQNIQVQEGQAKLWVNLKDYIDTGLFLDHRLLRLKFEKLNNNTKFLNLFCYTAAASVHAALAGALTTNIDLSNTYLRWAEENFKLNNLKIRDHHFIACDVRQWLQIAKGEYDVIFLDPPSFSNSKRMQGVIDIQRDHKALINMSMPRLGKAGILYFSTNLRRFLLDESLSREYQIQDITSATIDVDFKHDLKVHRCYEIKHIIRDNL
ncbi:MAG: 23S rRNA (guanine(2445)-N(2))/(guanine(2069)-N(7))-methyltransferase [Legionellales bacterium RIFCSPHIGHO2_12_FULL_37_14]|nr:MAG: 23S rRNA (guanine(2445)-N(2))/(guanine(2069)-N(7))-methyltransferase [Legionellales bacterium RIFCSPHIGHO2_12_FULL_37_14]